MNKIRIKRNIFLLKFVLIIIFLILKFIKFPYSTLIRNNLNNNKIIEINNFKQKKYNNIDAVLLMLPHHGNIGEQAIAIAEMKFLKEIVPNIKFVYNLENYINYINNNTIIILHGGGNLGWTYRNEEKNRRKIIKSYPNNRIIIFPQTIYFENKDKEQQIISSEIYSNHPKLIIITREKVSFNIAKYLFPKNKILITPDIVTYLDDLINLNNSKRNGALLILRKDREKFLDNDRKNQLFEVIKKAYTIFHKVVDSPGLEIS